MDKKNDSVHLQLRHLEICTVLQFYIDFNVGKETTGR